MLADDLGFRHILWRIRQAPHTLLRSQAAPTEAEDQTGAGGGHPNDVAPPVIPTGTNPDPAPTYRLPTFAVLAWAAALVLAAVDESADVPHASAIISMLFLTAVIAIVSLLSTLRQVRAWRRAQIATSAEFTDSITGLRNYRYLLLRLEEEISRARRYGRPLALAVVDVNSLGSVNREYGWDCGDQILRHVAEFIKERLRGADLAARLSDDHFAIIVPECDGHGARVLVERLEQHLASSPANVEMDDKSQRLWVGISVGVSVLGDESEGPGELVHAAETDLQVAKEERDRQRQRWLAA